MSLKADVMAARPQRVKLATSRVTRDPARQALAEVISAATVAEQKVTQTRSAIVQAKDLVRAKVLALEDASIAVESARDATASNLATAMTQGISPSPDRLTRDARNRQIDAEDELEAARSALAELETTLPAAERTSIFTDLKLTEAVAAVVRSRDVSALVQEAIAIQNDLIDRRLVLRHLDFNKLIAPADLAACRQFLDQSTLPTSANLTVEYGNELWPTIRPDSRPGGALPKNLRPWPRLDALRASIDALARSADAELEF